MKYLELIINVNKHEIDSLVEDLASAGFTSLSIDDPEDLRDIEEHPEWYKYDYIDDGLTGADSQRKPTVTLYFSDDEEGRKEADRAEALLQGIGSGNDWRIAETEDDSSWLYKWQENFKPTKVGERFVVKPSWEDYEASDGELVIEMDPGMAFGSGLHETTTLCIKALEKESAASVLDVGTGTGILAIAAAMLGAERCLGIDIDADAVRIAKENVERNGLADRIEIREGDLMEDVGFRADIIVANLMADLVIRLAPAAAEHLESDGMFISSGILDVKEEVVADAVKAAGFEIKAVLHDGEWCAIVAEKE